MSPTDWKSKIADEVQYQKDLQGLVEQAELEKRDNEMKKDLEDMSAIKKRAQHFVWTMERSKTRKLEILRQMIAGAKDKDASRKAQHENEESNLLSEFQHILLKEERYIFLLQDVTTWYEKRFYNAVSRYDRSSEQYRSLSLAMSSILKFFAEIFTKITERIHHEREFIKKWRGGTILGMLTFWKQKDVLKDFGPEMTQLHDAYAQLDAYLARCLAELPVRIKSIKEKADALQRLRDAETKAYLARKQAYLANKQAGIAQLGNTFPVALSGVAKDTEDLAGDLGKCVAAVAIGSALSSIFDSSEPSSGFSPGGGSSGGGGASDSW